MRGTEDKVQDMFLYFFVRIVITAVLISETLDFNLILTQMLWNSHRQYFDVWSYWGSFITVSVRFNFSPTAVSHGFKFSPTSVSYGF